MVNFAAFDLNLLRVFDALMSERGVTRAGERVGLSQPAVSAALNRLRNALGDPLFVRAGNEMVPTDRAMDIAPSIREALQRVEEVLSTRDTFDPATAEVTFTLRGADFFSMRLMPDLCKLIMAEAPRVKLRFLDTGYGDLFQLLSDDTIDAAFDRPLDMPAWVSSALVFPSPFVVIASRDHAAIAHRAIAMGGELPIDLFCDLPHAIRSVDGSMSGMVDDALALTGRKRNVMLALPHFQAVALAVAKGRLVSVVPEQLACAVAGELGLSIFRPPFEIPVPEVKMYWHSRRDDSAQHVWLRENILRSVNRLWKP